MRFHVALTADAESVARGHLLQHYRRGEEQEDLCFALWRPSTGLARRTALIDELILPEKGDRLLHGNTSFCPDYLMRALGVARSARAGLAFMHSHPTEGWQGMSSSDVVAERDVLAYPATADGGGEMCRRWCEKVRVIRPSRYVVHHNDAIAPPSPRRRILARTFDTWGRDAQALISRLRVGIVGLGSVGCVVAETVARIGVADVLLVDPDRVEEHNLDRLLYGTLREIGKHKTLVAARAMRKHATAESIKIEALPLSIHDTRAYRSALDCDVIFSCVDRPIARDVLNYIAHAHLVPVVDGGVAVESNRDAETFFAAHWRAHLATPYHRCLRCARQYTSSDVVMELDGSLDDPAYVTNLPANDTKTNQNVFPFGLAVAGMDVNLMLRYLLAPEWWPVVGQQEHQFLTAETSARNEECRPHCSFRDKRARGDAVQPPYLDASLAEYDPCSQNAWARAGRRPGARLRWRRRGPIVSACRLESLCGPRAHGFCPPLDSAGYQPLNANPDPIR